MEQIIIQVKDDAKAKTLMNFLKTLDFVKVITSSETPVIEQDINNQEVEFFALAGLWAGREISADSIRQKAWPQRR